MIRWREEKDCYRLEISHPVLACCLTLASVPLLFAPCLVPITAWGISDRTGLVLSFLCFGVGSVASAVAALYTGYHSSRQNAWVEIALRGGTARWEGTAWLAIFRFERVSEGSGGVRVDALLRDRTRQRVLGPWKMFGKMRADKLVAQMNEYVCADSSPPTQESQP